MCKIQRSDSVGESHVQFLAREEGEVGGTEVRVSQLGEQNPGEGAHQADGRVHGGHIRHGHRTVGRQPSADPHLATSLLDCGGNHHKTEINNLIELVLKKVLYSFTDFLINLWYNPSNSSTEKSLRT